MQNNEEQRDWNPPHLNHIEREYHILDDSHSQGEHTPTYYGPPPEDDESIGDNTIQRHQYHDRQFVEWIDEQRDIAIEFEGRLLDEIPAAYMTFDSDNLSHSYDNSFLGWVEQSYYQDEIWHQPADHTNNVFTFQSQPPQQEPQHKVKNLEGAYQFLRFYMTQPRYQLQDEDTKLRIQTIVQQLARLLGIFYYAYPNHVLNHYDNIIENTIDLDNY